MFNQQLKCLACLVNHIFHLLHSESADRGPIDLQDTVPRVDGTAVVQTDVHSVDLFLLHSGGIVRRGTFHRHGEATSVLSGGQHGDECDRIGQSLQDRLCRRPFKHGCQHQLIVVFPTVKCSLLHQGICIPVLNDHLATPAGKALWAAGPAISREHLWQKSPNLVQ